MTNSAIELKKRLLANIAVINFLESELTEANDAKATTIQSIYTALVDEINANLAKIHPEFGNYLSRTIANFRSLDNSYFYKNKQDTDTITIKNYLLEVLNFGVLQGRTFVTLPAHMLPRKAFIEFFKKLGVVVTKSKGMSIFIQEISRDKEDKTKYVCFNLNFREI